MRSAQVHCVCGVSRRVPVERLGEWFKCPRCSVYGLAVAARKRTRGGRRQPRRTPSRFGRRRDKTREHAVVIGSLLGLGFTLAAGAYVVHGALSAPEVESSTRPATTATATHEPQPRSSWRECDFNGWRVEMPGRPVEKTGVSRSSLGRRRYRSLEWSDPQGGIRCTASEVSFADSTELRALDDEAFVTRVSETLRKNLRHLAPGSVTRFKIGRRFVRQLEAPLVHPDPNQPRRILIQRTMLIERRDGTIRLAQLVTIATEGKRRASHRFLSSLAIR